MPEIAGRQSLASVTGSFTRNQLVGGATQSAADADEGGDEDVGFTGLDFSEISAAQVHLFGELFLSETLQGAFAA